MTAFYHQASFLLSVAEQKQLPPDAGYEVAIAGRSNAGKSSVLNKITRIKQLARVSKTPGRTQLINIFQVDANRRLVDLPGYGYAKVPLAIKHKWEKEIDLYMNQRSSLKGLVVVMDIRHPFRELDVQLLDYCMHRNLPAHVLLNKADKLSRGAGLNILKEAENYLATGQNMVTDSKESIASGVSVQLFSAAKASGLKELYSVLDKWYEY